MRALGLGQKGNSVDELTRWMRMEKIMGYGSDAAKNRQKL